MSCTNATAGLYKKLLYQRLVPTAVAAAAVGTRLANCGLADCGSGIGAQTGSPVTRGSLGGEGGV